MVAQLQNIWHRSADDNKCHLTDFYVSPHHHLAAGSCVHEELGQPSAQKPWLTPAMQPSFSPFQAAAEDAPEPAWTDLLPTYSETPDQTQAWGQGLSRRRLSDLSSTFANSQLLTAYSPSVDPLTTASSSLDPNTLACFAAMSPASLDSPSPSLQGSPSLPLPDMPGSQSNSLPVMANQASAPSKIQMTLLSAPAAFGLPIAMHKPLTPPFTVS